MRKIIIPLIAISFTISCDESTTKFATLEPYTEIRFGYEGRDIDGLLEVREFPIQDSIPFNTLGEGIVIIVREFNLPEGKTHYEMNSAMFISSNSDIEYHDHSLDNFSVLGSGGGLNSTNGFEVYTFDFDVLIWLDYEEGIEEYDNVLHVDPTGDIIKVKHVSAESGETVEAIKIYRE